MDEIFVGDEIALRRVTTYLEQLSVITNQITQLLLDVQKGCDPQKFFNEIRPWFRGVDSTDTLRPWIFQGVEEDTSLDVPTELSGPSAGQSSLVHALDIFLGVDIHSHDDSLTGSSDTAKPAFLDRMRKYMPRYHRNFLTHLSNNPRPLRTFVEKSANAELIAAYNAAVKALKEFRDAHIKIVTLYIIIPANKASREGISARKVDTAAVDRSSGPLKGTGGTELSKFLKGVRDCTTRSLISDP
jgi:indoleamine 2,3-dioxygenase